MASRPSTNTKPTLFPKTWYYFSFVLNSCLQFLLLESRRETSVIARIRAGSSCTLGPYTIAMIITEALQEYRDILSIGFSSTNFTIDLNSTDFQLAVLYSRIIEESDLILDILPWCSEYVNFNLPWIIQRKNKGMQHTILLIYNFILLTLSILQST